MPRKQHQQTLFQQQLTAIILQANKSEITRRSGVSRETVYEFTKGGNTTLHNVLAVVAALGYEVVLQSVKGRGYLKKGKKKSDTVQQEMAFEPRPLGNMELFDNEKVIDRHGNYYELER